jgi:hypothetical protein
MRFFACSKVRLAVIKFLGQQLLVDPADVGEAFALNAFAAGDVLADEEVLVGVTSGRLGRARYSRLSLRKPWALHEAALRRPLALVVTVSGGAKGTLFCLKLFQRRSDAIF